jgi:hypothetical protein
MNTTRRRLHAHFGILPVLLALTCPTFVQSNTPIIPLGAPGQPARELTADEAIDRDMNPYTRSHPIHLEEAK